jgi:hypothetical protein
LREDRFLVHVLALMIRAELTDDERQAHVLECVKIIVDRAGVVIHLVHMYREQGVGTRVSVENLRRVALQGTRPVLTPVSRIDNQRMSQTGVTQGLDRGHGIADVLRFGSGVAERLVGDIDQYEIFLTHDRAHDVGAGPVLGGVRDIYRGRRFRPAGRVVHFQHTDQPVRLAQRNNVGDIRTAVAGPLPAGRQYHTHRVGTGRRDIRERRGVTRIPGVSVIDAADNKRSAVIIDQLSALN